MINFIIMFGFILTITISFIFSITVIFICIIMAKDISILYPNSKMKVLEHMPLVFSFPIGLLPSIIELINALRLFSVNLDAETG